MRKNTIALLIAVLALLAGCGQSSDNGLISSRESEFELEQSTNEPEISRSATEIESEEEREFHPPDSLKTVKRAGDNYWKVITPEWVLTDANKLNPPDDENNIISVEHFSTAIVPPFIFDQDGTQREIPDTIVKTIAHPSTGRKITRTTTYTNEVTQYGEYVYDYIVEFEGIVLSQESGCVPGPGSDGPSFMWVDKENIVSSFFSPNYLYNIVDQTYLRLTLPPAEPRTELSNSSAPSRRETLVTTECTFINAKSHSYIVTHIDGTELEDSDYARDYGAGRQTLYHVNWETGESFAFYENDYRPQGSGRPEYLSIGYQFDNDGSFLFVADNRYNLAGLGEEIGQLIGYVDVATQQTTMSIEVPFGVMNAGIYGDYIVFITSFYSDSDYYVYLYSHKEKTIVREFRGELHGSYMGKYPVFLIREENVVSVFDLENRTEYQLKLDDVKTELPNFEIEYNVHSLTFETSSGNYRIDYEKVLGLESNSY